MFGGIVSMALFIHPQIRYHRCHLTLHLNFLGPHTHPHHPQNVSFNLSITDVIMLHEIINIQSIITFFQQTHLLHHESC